MIDDDDSGETADVVVIKSIVGETVNIELHLCKFSKKATAGARVEDFYTVCGQTQKSIGWKVNPEKFFKHLINRHVDRLKKYSVGRIEKGDISILSNLKKKSKMLKLNLECFVIQPGLSKKLVTKEILHLLGSTELYLSETYKVPLKVYASA